MKQDGSTSIDLAPQSLARAKFVDAVGDVLGLNHGNLYTPDFKSMDEKEDFAVGNNFLTTQVTKSKDVAFDYPKRPPAPLLSLDKEKVEIYDNFTVSLNSHFFNFPRYRVGLAIWLARREVVANDSEGKIVCGFLTDFLQSNYSPNVADIFKISQDDLDEFTNDVDEPLGDSTVDLRELFELIEAEDDGSSSNSHSESSDAKAGKNLVFYGAPATGKSRSVDDLVDATRRVRTVFHPDLQNSDFFGSLKPSNSEGKIGYVFAPGPFLNAVLNALKEPDQHHYLVIEELNRAPAAAVFGELFQLLDREANGESSYSVDFPTPESRHWLEEKLAKPIAGLRLPSNLSIFATMNSADQGVYPLDTAFRRRWEQVYVPINFEHEEAPSGRLFFYQGGEKQFVPWRAFASCLNERLVREVGIEEDRLFGQWFVKEEELGGPIPQKILLYLWDDLLRHGGREAIFNEESLKTLGDIYRVQAGGTTQTIFCQAFLDELAQFVVVPDQAVMPSADGG